MPEMIIGLPHFPFLDFLFKKYQRRFKNLMNSNKAYQIPQKKAAGKPDEVTNILENVSHEVAESLKRNLEIRLSFRRDHHFTVLREQMLKTCPVYSRVNFVLKKH
eukprot:gb/GEZJ01008226.1/.p1 GENE.gb/GEZJ01008226.1/~~gb/GEZJ01008226.1/.p1  ORF type:complete len:105 (+),score=9.67 gb/GEZJ01008226.1/:115-429(+)